MSVLDRPSDRPLLAPLFATLAAEVEQLDARAFLADAGRRARIYADLARSLPVDVLVVDSGSGWDLDPAGHALIADLLRRVRAVVELPLAVTLTGPATRGDAQAVLAAARAAAEAGAEVIFVREDVASARRLRAPERAALGLAASSSARPACCRRAAGRRCAAPFLPCVETPADGAYALAVAPGGRRPAQQPPR